MIKAAIFDLDGTIFRRDELVTGAADFLLRLRQRNVQYRFYTNRAARLPSDIAEQLSEMLGYLVNPEHVLTSALVTAQQHVGKRVFCVGEPALKQALEDAGATLVDESPDAVVVGYTYKLDLSPDGNIGKAVRFIQSGAEFVATNPDQFVIEDGLRATTCGAVIAPIQITTDIAPTIYGKPKPAGAQLALKQMSVTAEETIFVGDNINTDIACAHAAGIPSVLILSGVTKREAITQSNQPRWVVEDYLDPLWNEILNSPFPAK
jgi:HAD superfamily hydrolase (TIGR01450 family)